MIHEVWDILAISIPSIVAVEIVFIYIKAKKIKKELAAKKA